MNVLAVAVKRCLAIFKRRCVDTQRAVPVEYPLESRVESQKRFPEGPTGKRLVVSGLGLSGIGMMAMAVEMRWAITHPILIRSQWTILSCGRRKR